MNNLCTAPTWKGDLNFSKRGLKGDRIVSEKGTKKGPSATEKGTKLPDFKGGLPIPFLQHKNSLEEKGTKRGQMVDII